MNQSLSSIPVGITGIGSYAPARVLTNADLEKMVDTTDQWIMDRTGIRERRIAAENEATSDMGAAAARQALEMAGLNAEELDLIIVATITPDMGFPNTACFVQAAIGAVNAYAYDVEAACSGFLYALEQARNAIMAGSVRNVLVIGAEKISCITDWTDRTMCVLFGDGAGAAVVQRVPGRKGILSSVMRSDGRLAELLKLPGGGSRFPTSAETLTNKLHFMKMDGRKVFVHAVTLMTEVANEALSRSGMGIDDVKMVIPHQANMRIISAIGERLGGDPSKYYVNLERFGNTSAASIGLAMDEAVRTGKLVRGDKVLLVAFGGGFTWGATVLEW